MHRNCLLRTLTIATCSFLLSINPAAHAAPALPGEAGIVPKPVKLEMGQGTFLVSAKTRVLYDKASAAQRGLGGHGLRGQQPRDQHPTDEPRDRLSHAAGLPFDTPAARGTITSG